jgi:hypothetical protein
MQTKSGQNSTRNAIWAQTMALLFAASFTLIACKTTTPPPAPTGTSAVAIAEGVPGGIFVDTVEVSARVKAIDTAKREVTLLGPEGEEFTTKVGPEAVNFDQVKVGDLVKVTHTKELVVFLDEEGASTPDGSGAVVARAEKGAQPGGLVAGVSQVPAIVRSIDRTDRTATLQTEDGTIATFPVRDDIDLSKRKVGEKVVFQVTEMIAISLEKQ